jgi:hypothetical protein
MGRDAQRRSEYFDQLADQTDAAEHEKEASRQEQAQDGHDDEVAGS